jgi:predicted alpha/beta-fold hydrolase
MRISLGDVSLWFDVSGPSVIPQEDTTAERPVVVAVHGGPGLDHMTVKSALGPLAEDFQVLYFDLRGHGRSDHSSAEFWNRTYADETGDYQAEFNRVCYPLYSATPGWAGGIPPVPGPDDQEHGRQPALRQSAGQRLRPLDRDRRRRVPRAGPYW